MCRFFSGLHDQVNSCNDEWNTEELTGVEWQGVVSGGLAEFEEFANNARTKNQDQKTAKDKARLLPLFEFPIKVKQDAKRNEITNGLIKLRRVARSRVVVANCFVIEILEFKSPRHIGNITHHFVVDQITQADKRCRDGYWRSNAV